MSNGANEPPSSAPQKMTTAQPIPTRGPRYVCGECGLAGYHPIVRAVANPRHPQHGRCSNRQACASRQRRNKNRAKDGNRA